MGHPHMDFVLGTVILIYSLLYSLRFFPTKLRCTAVKLSSCPDSF